jgi:hypothetical protein
MKNIRPPSRLRTLRQLCFALCFGLVLIASAPDGPASVEAKKGNAPARTATVTAAPRVAFQSSRATVGEWGALVNLKTVPVHISLLPDGRLLYWGRDKAVDHDPDNGDHWDVGDKCNTYTWSPSDLTGAGLTIKNNTTNLFCSGHSFLADGRLLVTGGHSRYNAPLGKTPAPWQDGIGEEDVNIFDYRFNTWTRVGAMPQGRWYPTNVTLATGETVIVSGGYWDGSTLVTGGQRAGAPDTDFNKTLDLFTLPSHIRPFTSVSASEIPLYPYLHLAPDGRVFIGGAGPEPSKYFDPTVRNPDGTTGKFTIGPDFDPHHLEGSAVVYDGVAGKIMMVGGRTMVPFVADPVTNTVETINLTSAPTWLSSVTSPTQVAAMNIPRKYHTATVLPDGQVLVTGGTQCTSGPGIDCMQDASGNNVGAARQPELWTPAIGATRDKWTLLAPSPVRTGYPVGIPRSYHSTAVLLPDARVLIGGGGLPAAGGEIANGTLCQDIEARLSNPDCLKFGHKDVEFFSPPYLFDSSGNPVRATTGTRPSITTTPPPSVSYGQTFFVGTANAGTNPKVSLVRLASVTHGFNQDQRVIFLQRTLSGTTGLNVTAPQPNACPPGHYMMFVMNANGVPSVAQIIKVQQDDGYLDGADCNQIWGWAWDRNNPNIPINVNIYDGADLIAANVPANVFRQDLLNAGKGNGFHAFVINTPVNLNDGRTHSISVKFASTINNGNNLSSSPRPITCGGRMFPTQVPLSTAGAAGSTWEQGTRFSSAIGGKITHVRFYKAAGETGSHIGRIWSDTGVQLAQTLPFANETASGWQVQPLQSPLTITAGVKYRVSYNINTLGAKTFDALTQPIINWPLTVHGVAYSTPSATFPATGSTSNLFADVLFNSPQ